MTDPNRNISSDPPEHPHAASAGPHHRAEELREAAEELREAAEEAVTNPQVGLASSGGLDSVISVAAFMIANRLGGLGWAIAASTLWSLRAGYVRRRRGLAIGKLLPITAAVLIARGVVGIVSDSKAIYFGSGIAIQAGIGLALIVSVIVGRSFIGEVAHKVLPFPPFVVRDRIYRSTMAQLTLIAGTYELAKSGWDVWIYNNSSTNGFVLLRFIAGWLTGVVAITGGIILADHRLKRIEGFDGMLPMLEAMNGTANGTAKGVAPPRRPVHEVPGAEEP